MTPPYRFIMEWTHPSTRYMLHLIIYIMFPFRRDTCQGLFVIKLSFHPLCRWYLSPFILCGSCSACEQSCDVMVFDHAWAVMTSRSSDWFKSEWPCWGQEAGEMVTFKRPTLMSICQCCWLSTSELHFLGGFFFGRWVTQLCFCLIYLIDNRFSYL